MKKYFKTYIAGILTIGLVFTSTVPAYATSSHNKDALFNFHSGKDEAEERYEAYTEEEQATTPISNLIVDKEANTQRMIVVTNKPLSAADHKKILGEYGTYNKPMESIFGFSAYIPEKNIEILLRNDLIENIYIDSVVTTMGYYQPSPVEVTSAPVVWEANKNTGSGVGVAVLDTGIYPHKDISYLVAFKDFVNNKTTPYDDNGHGTHVAGLISGNGSLSGNQYQGVAPKANLIGVKVLDSNEKGYISNVISGIDWVIQNKDRYNIKVMNLSLGTTYSGSSDPLIEAVEKANGEGITVIVAGGNTGYNGKVTSPAASAKAIAVGSMDSNYTVNPNDDKPSSFTVLPQTINGVKKPEIFAPGTDSISLLSLEGTRVNSDRGNVIEGYYYKMSGTSMAAPVVSGVAALLYSQNPSLSPEQVKSKIVSNGLSVSGLNTLNAAKAFGLTPEWKEETSNSVPATPTVPVPNEEDEFILPELEELSGKKESIEKTPSLASEEVSEEVFDIVDYFTEEDVVEVDYPQETTAENKVSASKSEVEKETAVIPDVNPYIVNNGYPFVKETYEKRNILDDLAKESSDYKNEVEVLNEYERVKDIVMLFNLINRSFTRQDFLYFEQRMQND